MKSKTETDDILAGGVIALAKLFDVSISPQALLHGLCLEKGRLALEHLDDACARAGVQLTLWKQPLKLLTNTCCPMLIVQPAAAKVFVVEKIIQDKGAEKVAVCQQAEDGLQEIPLAQLLGDSNSKIFIARAIKTKDDRTSEIPVAKRAHWFWSALKVNRGIYGHIIAGTLVINLLALAVPLVTMNIFDRVVANAAFTTLWALAIGAGIAAVFDLILRTVRAVMIDRASARSDVLLANRIFSHVIGARLQGRLASVGVQANTLREFEALREFFNSATIAALGDLPFLILFVGVIALVAGPLVWVPLVAIPVVLILGYLTQRKLDKIVAQGFLESAQKNAVVVESLSGLETLKSLAAESWAASHWEASVASHLRHSLKSRSLMTAGSNLITFATSITTIALLVYGVYLVTAGTITPGAMFAAVILNGRCMGPLGQLAGLLTRLHQARMAFVALRQVVDLPQEREEGATYLRKSEFDGSLDFDNVRFAYEEEAPDALRDISLKLKPGEKVGIVGGIGSGKTTLLKLALGLLQPDDGRVLVDNMPVSQLDPANLRGATGTLLQDAMLFHGDIRSNVCLGVYGVGEQQLLRALDISGALDWIRTLPSGLDTIIGERGAGLSGGQKQTLCLARVFLRNPALLLLDEPTSSMDGAMEKSFIKKMKKHASLPTLMLVTHKPTLLELVDRLIVMERGKILLDGPKAEVLQKLQQVTADRQKRNAA